MTRYVVYDVFTDTAFGGNPLAVIPDATGLSEDQLWQIAREFNFSETTFVYPPNDPANDARVRILTPTIEMPFAGHPTVGTAIALNDLGLTGPNMTLELGVGPIPVSISQGEAQFKTRVPLSQSAGPSLADVGQMIALDPAAICTSRHAPVLAGVGVPYVLAELASAKALEAATPNLDAFRKVAGPNVDQLALYVYLRDGASIRARMFQPFGGIMEDPATGSAAAALVAFLGHLEGRSAAFDIIQGVEMGRPSLIGAIVTVEDGIPVEVAISGHAVKVMEGHLCL